MSTVRQVGRILSTWGLPAAVLLATFAVSMQKSTVSQTANDLIYDRFVRLDAQFSPTPAAVMLVHADAELEQRPDDYLQLIERLQDLGAAGVGVIGLDVRHWSPVHLQRLTELNGLVIGHVAGNTHALPRGLVRGSIRLRQTHDGIHRRYDGMGAGGGIPSFATQLASDPWGTDRLNRLTHDEFGVRFRGPAESLPHVSAAKVLRDEVTSELVRDRVVLIGQTPDPTLPGLTTPTTTARQMSIVEYHGHALNTLLTTRPLREMRRAWEWPLFALGAVVFAAAGRRIGLRLGIPLLLAALAFQGLAAWLVLRWTQLWLPLASLMFVEAMAWLWSFDRRLRFCEAAWPLLRRGVSSRPRYQDPPSLRADEPPWTMITTMLQQLFPLDKVALLLAHSAGDRLEPVTCLGDPHGDVPRNQRDLKRRPFDESIRRRTAVQIDRDAPYFKAHDDRSQYFVPLFHGEQMTGALIVELATAELDQLPGFAKQLTDVSAEVAGWLSQYQRLSSAAGRQRRRWNRFTTPPELGEFVRLQSQLQTLERRLHQTDQVVEQSSVGEAVFDLGGSAVTLNATMLRLLRAWDIGTPETHLLDILHSLTLRDIAECRQIIRRVILQRRCERLAAAEPHGDQPIVLVVQPVLCSDQSADDPTAIQAFNVEGIHLEILSAELLSDIHDVREQMTDQTLSTVLDTLSDVSILAAKAREAVPPHAWRQFHASVRRAQLTVQRCQSLLASGQSADVDVHLPVHVSTLVRAAMLETRSIADQWGTVVALNLPSDLPVVAANPHRLRQVIAATITVLVEHARENSHINISASVESNQVILTIENPSCGVALDRLADGQRGLVDRPPSEAERLMMARQWLLQWGGDLQLQAELGEGASVRLILQQFDWHDLRDLTAEPDVATAPLSLSR